MGQDASEGTGCPERGDEAPVELGTERPDLPGDDREEHEPPATWDPDPDRHADYVVGRCFRTDRPPAGFPHETLTIEPCTIVESTMDGDCHRMA